eukprot:gene10092-11172_t
MQYLSSFCANRLRQFAVIALILLVEYHHVHAFWSCPTAIVQANLPRSGCLQVAVQIPSSSSSSLPLPSPKRPLSVETLAHDTSYSIIRTLSGTHRRVRVDIEDNFFDQERKMLKWLRLVCEDLILSYQGLHLYLDDAIWEQKFRRAWKANHSPLIDDDQLIISNLEDTCFLATGSRILFIFAPSNLFVKDPSAKLEDIQALCFHGALSEVPIVMANPSLMASGWGDGEVSRSPLLLSDFKQAFLLRKSMPGAVGQKRLPGEGRRGGMVVRLPPAPPQAP